MADRASPCSAEKRRLRPASSERIHHAPRMNCMLTSTGQPHRSVSPSNRCSTAPTARTAVAVCNENAKLRYVPWCWPSSLSVPAFPLSTANPSFIRGRGNLALPCRGIHPRFVVVPLTVVVARAPLPDPRGQPRLPLMFLPLSAAPVDIDAVALDVAGVTLSCVLGTRASVPAPSPPCFRQFGSFWWQQIQHFLAPSAPSPPGHVLTLELHLPMVSRPLLKGSLSRAGPAAAVGEGGSSFPVSNAFWGSRVHAAVGNGGSASTSSSAFRTPRIHLVRRSSHAESRPAKNS